jgi:uncharacterized protein with PQ loop repeat
VTFYTVTVIIGWIAVALGGLVAFTQFRRMKSRGIEGVSLATWTFFLYMALFWILYGVSIHSWQLIIGSALALPLQMMIWGRLKPWTRPGVALNSLLFFAAFCCAPAIFWGWSGAAVGAGTAGWITRSPQLVQLVRHEGATGVSASSWLTAAVVSGLWVIYYSGERLWPVMSVTAVAGLVSLSIAALAGWRHRQVDDVFPGYGHAIAD